MNSSVPITGTEAECWRSCDKHLPGSVFELEDGQQGRGGSQYGERGQTEVVAECPERVVEERQRDEKRHEQYFQPNGHGSSLLGSSSGLHN